MTTREMMRKAIDNVEFTNSPPTFEQIPQKDLELFCRSLTEAVMQYKLQNEEKDMEEKIKEIRAESRLNSTVKEIEEKLANLSQEEREEVISKLCSNCNLNNK